MSHDASGEASSQHAGAPACNLEMHSHLLHGIIHLNGFGHLLRVNGLEGGSQHFTGVSMSLNLQLPVIVKATDAAVKEGPCHPA